MHGSGHATGGSPGEAVRLAQADYAGFDASRVVQNLAIYTAAICNPSGTLSCPVKIEVKAGCSRTNGKDNPAIRVLPEKIVVPPERKGRAVGIAWEIVNSPDWRFAPSGIKFYGNPGDLVDRGIAGGTRWLYIDKALTGGEFNYAISVVNTSSGEKCEGDPSIVNDW
jgi:hypothetical protein